MCDVCDQFPHPKEGDDKQKEFVDKMILEGKYAFDSEDKFLECLTCGHVGVWPPEYGSAESVF